jgi:hypothetical protein
MTNQQKYEWAGVVSLFVAAAAGRWLITPINHPNATGLQTGAAYLQFFSGAACALFAWKRSKGGSRASR